MEKDFDRWNKQKKAINACDDFERVYSYEGDIEADEIGEDLALRPAFPRSTALAFSMSKKIRPSSS